MKRLLWITNAHLDHHSEKIGEAWFDKLDKTKADMLLLGGDIANSRISPRLLARIENSFQRKVALVVGNHDFYHTSI
jgi:3',5'-cyclic AMP phosphodiesterase CpdA